MSWLNIFGIAVGLAMDALAVSIATGLVVPKVTGRRVFRMSFHFALFQFLMPIIGWSAGRVISGFIAAYDHWAAFGLLSVIGGKLLWEAFSNHEPERKGDPTRGWRLLLLSIATSIDALAVGLSMAFLRIPILIPSFIIGVVTATLTTLGLCFAGKIGRRFGIYADVAGGLVLLAIGARILVSHLTAL